MIVSEQAADPAEVFEQAAVDISPPAVTKGERRCSSRLKRTANGKSAVMERDSSLGNRECFWQVDEGGTKHKQSKLFDTSGYSFIVGKHRGRKTVWHCTFRNKWFMCEAIVIQTDDKFTYGECAHSHPSNTGRDGCRVKPKEEDSDVESSWHVIPAATKRGGEVLANDQGYTYTLKSRRQGTTYWQCCVRSRSSICHAGVTQKGGDFIPGQNPHVHPPNPELVTSYKIKADVKSKVLAQRFMPASKIVNEVLSRNIESRESRVSPVNPINLVRAASRQRNSTVPDNPSCLDFVLNLEFIPKNFTRADISVEGKRHLIFATPSMLVCFSKVKKWYVDISRERVMEPFEQLCIFHTFSRSGKPIPLAFVVMSSNKVWDYKVILLKLIALAAADPQIEEVGLEFEESLWSAFESVLPTVPRRGCAYRWVQTIWQKIQDMELEETWEDAAMQELCQRLIGLVFLPQDLIPSMFHQCTQKADTAALRDFLTYFRNTWIDSVNWNPSVWSAFHRDMRTSEECDVWVRRLGGRSGDVQISLYVLINRLYTEAKAVAEESSDKPKPFRNKFHREFQCFLNELWAEYDSGTKTADQLLEACAEVYGLCNVTS